MTVLVTDTTVEVNLTSVTVTVEVDQGGSGGGGTAVNLSDAAPVELGDATPGVSTLASRGDHRHPHGAQLGGNLHALATDALAGFMSAFAFRKLDQIVDPRDYGLVELDEGNPATYSLAQQEANVVAMEQAIAATADGRSRLEVPAGVFFMGRTLVIDRPVHIAGAGRDFFTGTNFAWPRATTGIRIAYQGGPRAAGARYSRLEGLRVMPQAGLAGQPNIAVYVAGGAYVANASFVRPTTANGFVYVCTTSGTAGAEPVWPTTDGATVTTGGAVFTCRQVYGVEMLARATLRDFSIDGMHGHGLAIVASTGDGNNANNFALWDVRSGSNNGKGVFARGADANAGVGVLVDVNANLMDGIDDASFLGCWWFGCHADSNGMPGDNGLPPDTWNGRPFRNGTSPDNASSRATFVACYVEGGQARPLVDAFGSWLFGLSEAGVEGAGTHIRNEYANSIAFLNRPGSGAATLLRTGRVNSDVVLEWASEVDGFNPWQWIYGIINGAVSAGAWSWLYRGTDSILAMFDDTFAPATPALQEERRNLYLPKGASMPQRLFARTANRNGTEYDTGKAQTNRGASGDIAYNLPGTSQCRDGWYVDFEIAAAFYFRINAQGSDVIRLGSIVSAAAGYVRSNTVGDTWRIRKSTNGVWVVQLYAGSGLVVDL